MVPCGAALILGKEESERDLNLADTCSPTTPICWLLQDQPGRAEKWIELTADSELSTEVGKGEVRMQCQLAVVARKLQLQNNTSVSAWQLSSDSDNISLAILATEGGSFGSFK